MKRFLTFLCLLIQVACVAVPTPQEMLDTGFRTPEMTFHTFQMAVRGDLPRLEYRCLSSGMRPSQTLYREFRESDLKGKIEYWLGIPDAKVTGSKRLSADRWLLRAQSHGHDFEVEFVREHFWQVWQGEQALRDEALSPSQFRQHLDIYREDGLTFLLGSTEIRPLANEAPIAQMPIEDLRASITEFRIGSEWKIDGFHGPLQP